MRIPRVRPSLSLRGAGLCGGAPANGGHHVADGAPVYRPAGATQLENGLRPPAHLGAAARKVRSHRFTAVDAIGRCQERGPSTIYRQILPHGSVGALAVVY